MTGARITCCSTCGRACDHGRVAGGSTHRQEHGTRQLPPVPCGGSLDPRVVRVWPRLLCGRAISRALVRWSADPISNPRPTETPPHPAADQLRTACRCAQLDPQASAYIVYTRAHLRCHGISYSGHFWGQPAVLRVPPPPQWDGGNRQAPPGKPPRRRTGRHTARG